MEYTIESFIDFCDEMMISANEGFTENTKSKIKKILAAFKQFFITLFNKIKEWVRVHLNGDKYINKTYYQKLQTGLDECIKEYKEYILKQKNALKKISDAINKNKDMSNAEITCMMIDEAEYIKCSFKNGGTFKYNDGSNAKDDKEYLLESYKKIYTSTNRDEIKAEKWCINELKKNYVLISLNEIDSWNKKMKEFEKLGNEFNQYALSLNIPEEKYNMLYRFTEIYKYSSAWTTKFTNALFKNIIDIEEIKKEAKKSIT